MVTGKGDQGHGTRGLLGKGGCREPLATRLQ